MGIEEAAGEALKNFNSTLMGSVFVVFMVLAGIAFRFLTTMIRELQEQLKLEREEHQKTRQAQIDDIRNLAHMASSFDGVTRSVERLSVVVETLGRSSK